MRRSMIGFALVLVAMLSFSAASFAKGAGKHAGGPGERGVDRLKDQLQKLDLSEDQTKQCTDILDAAQQQIQSAMADAKAGGDKTAAREKVKPIVKDTIVKLEGVMTPDQKQKFNSALKEMREQRKAKQNSDSPTTKPAA